MKVSRGQLILRGDFGTERLDVEMRFEDDKTFEQALARARSLASTNLTMEAPEEDAIKAREEALETA